MKLNLTKEVNYLGIIPDDKLTWKAHVREQVKKGLKALWSCNAYISRTWGLSPKKALWLYKRAIIPKISMDTALTRSELERLQRAACIMITGARRTTPTKVLMFLDLPTLGTTVESAALMAAYRLLRPNLKNLGIGHNRIWTKADKMDKFSMIKDHVTLRRTFGKYRTVILTREEWDKYWPNWLGKGQVWFKNEVCNPQGTGAGICKYQSKIQWHISLGLDSTAFQAKVAAIMVLDPLSQGPLTVKCQAL